jgi:hypothetical protein
LDLHKPSLAIRKHRFACLIGNGFSASYNGELLVPQLTRGIINELAALSGGDAALALSSFARQFAGYKEGDFESLLTPLENVGGALEHLTHLAPLGSVAPLQIRGALTSSGSFVKDLYRLGYGTVLRLVADRSRGMGDAVFSRTVVDFCQRVTDLRSRGAVAVGTLNYDGLLHAGFLKCLPPNQLADLSAGYNRAMLAPMATVNLGCQLLRTGDDLPRCEFLLINLHGSLSWLQNQATGQIAKFELEDLRKVRYWDSFVNGQVSMFPVLVLTNRKEEAVREAPFNFAYQVFERRLAKANRWVIAGYSFGDVPVNGAIRRAYQSRQRWRWSRPKVLVLDKGGSERELAARASAATGIDAGDIAVDVEGLPNSAAGSEWQKWAA